jgi:hypothetical protein
MKQPAQERRDSDKQVSDQKLQKRIQKLQKQG